VDAGRGTDVEARRLAGRARLRGRQGHVHAGAAGDRAGQGGAAAGGEDRRRGGRGLRRGRVRRLLRAVLPVAGRRVRAGLGDAGRLGRAHRGRRLGAHRGRPGADRPEEDEAVQPEAGAHDRDREGGRAVGEDPEQL
ncbi:MAG: hypothetical protein AVDCRST_MAG41-4311, partial [uncultured Corynebacteriales bacterium]